jgi:hypothetical protein
VKSLCIHPAFFILLATQLPDVSMIPDPIPHDYRTNGRFESREYGATSTVPSIMPSMDTCLPQPWTRARNDPCLTAV